VTDERRELFMIATVSMNKDKRLASFDKRRRCYSASTAGHAYRVAEREVHVEHYNESLVRALVTKTPIV